MFSICTHAHSQWLSPLVDGRVNSILLRVQTVPDFNEALLQLIDTAHTTFMHFLLHNTPDLIIQHWIQVWAVWWPEIRTNEVQRFMVSLTR